MSAEDNVAYGLVCRGMKKREAREQAREFLTLFNMQDFARRYPETLSGGEAQRIALARTLIVHPKLVLLDEPLSALDAPMRKKLAREISSMQKKIGFTAVMVTHDISEAKMMSDRIILMEKGRLRWEGAAADFPDMQDS
jgi:ABC-type Fe3+/spermidine/putrescine transport system ATPase subunit